ncbi:MAG: ATP phosphoribosyltransferase regulatory subunit [Clostridia bacterium]|nr:ATP phosphoribosyltransferase regulatory subunit [Clostridia bacterium]
MQLGFIENVMFSLRTLYNTYGYAQYTMSKFEEYDLYARNKDFLISDSVITFTDTNGKLMALKPDVTLSIVKNSKDEPNTVQKVFYNENVYRVSKGSHSFKEIMQVGLECLGAIDDYCICEVLTLAAESLQHISPACILDVSHIGLLSDLIDRMGVPSEKKAELFKCIGEKNTHELQNICREVGVDDVAIGTLKQVVTTVGKPSNVLPKLSVLLSDLPSWGDFEHIIRALENDAISEKLRIDFSVVDDIHYYNGIVFKGFINGLPAAVLSGGQYDKLMQKMKRQSGAVGFAVYMDMLERLDNTASEYDVDVVLLYDETTDLAILRGKVSELIQGGFRVLAQREKTETIRYKQLMKLRGNEVEILENNA